MSMNITYDEFDDLVPSIKRALSRTKNLAALELWGNLRENSPQDHGRLAGSWKLEENSNLSSEVSTNVEYALVQNEGSDPYEIYPREAKALHFFIGGREIFAKSVSHPGIAGTHYIDGSIAQTESRIDEFVAQALNEEGL